MTLRVPHKAPCRPACHQEGLLQPEALLQPWQHSQTRTSTSGTSQGCISLMEQLTA